MRAKGVDINQIVYITTTEGMNEFSDQFDSDVQPGWIYDDALDHHKKTEIRLEDGSLVEAVLRRFRVTTYTNNRFLPPDFIGQIMEAYANNQNYIDAYINGFFRPFNVGLAYKEYKSALHKIRDEEPDQTIPLIMTWDFNVCPQWVVLQEKNEVDPYTLRRYPKDVIIDNANHGGETLSEVLVEFVEKFPRYKFADTPIHIYGDTTGHNRHWKHEVAGDSDFKIIARKLRELGYRSIVIMAPKPPNPLERLSVEAVNDAFMRGRLLVCDKCDRILKSLSRTSWKNGEKGKLDKPQDDSWTHPMDAVKYYVWAKTKTTELI